jgi:plastocyanin/ribosomal protein L30/L7E
MKKIILMATLALFLAVGLSVLPAKTNAQNLGAKLGGRILIAVQGHGEAWYVDPSNQQRYFLGRPNDAFSLMQLLGLGISNKDFNSFNGKAPARLSGKILIKVEDKGMAYYVNPVDLKLYFLGRPADAFNIMRTLGLGITNADLDSISIPTDMKISILTNTYSPASVTIDRGAMVTWTNTDSVTHSIVSTNVFNFISLNTAQSISRIFTVTGTYTYHDNNNSKMTGTIIVK